MQLELEKIKELKIKAMFQLEFFLTNRLQSNDSKQFKFVQTLSFWLLDYIKFNIKSISAAMLSRQTSGIE